MLLTGLARRKRRTRKVGRGLLSNVVDVLKSRYAGNPDWRKAVADDFSIAKSFAGLARRRPRRRAAPKRRVMRGAGFFGDVWSGVKSLAKPVVRAVRTAVVDPAALLAGQAVGSFNPALGRLAQQGVYKLSDLAASKGYARRRRRPRKVGRAMKLAVIPAPLGMARRKRRVVRRKIGASYGQLLY